jgi:hypothetical protein
MTMIDRGVGAKGFVELLLSCNINNGIALALT